MPSIIAELIRRNVFRSAALYLAATWLVLQVADLVLDAFDGSTSIMRGLIVAFTIGFPVFVLLSWFYDLRGTRLVKDTGRSNEASRGLSSRAVNATIVILVILAGSAFSNSWGCPTSR